MVFSRGRQPFEQRLERLPVDDAFQRVVHRAERVRHRGRVVVGDVGGVEGDGGVGVRRLQPLEHLVLGELEVRGELSDGGGAAVALREVGGRLGQRQLHLLQPAWDPDRPALVAEVPLDLADDGRCRVRRELDAAVEVEPVDRLDQSDRCDLDQVVKRLAAVAKPPCEVLDERQVHLDQRVANLPVTDVVVGGTAELCEQLFGARAVSGALVPLGDDRNVICRR